ncbi:MAG TPA: FAD-dependent oxidoreductase, partial [Gemmatimonadaceae bacterium]|nr:FAD-dependent oxidoreductase [Gemmatimonadaceae bacterium]
MPVNAAAGRIAASRTDQRPDVVIIGDGIIGLTIAREMGRAGASCRVFGAPENGAASVAAAGLLAPSTGKLSADAERFSRTSLAMYPDFVESLREYEPTLSMITGMIEVSKSAAQVDIGPETRRLSRDDVAALEPELLAPNGGLFHVQ